MEEQLIAFIDLLGFSSIVAAHDDERQGQILSLLTSLARATCDSILETKYIDARNRELAVTPAISAFSDHIVVSFTGNPLVHNQLAHVGTGLIVNFLADAAARIFCSAIRLGCLVRGGIAFGPLHHGGRVVFGSGLVEAHELESKHAVYPRIVISARAAEKLGSNRYLNSDDDDFLCLDYVQAAYDLEVQSRRNNWIADVQTICKHQVSVLAQNNLPGLQKWSWFERRFNRFVANLPRPLPASGTDACGSRLLSIDLEEITNVG